IPRCGGQRVVLEQHRPDDVAPAGVVVQRFPAAFEVPMTKSLRSLLFLLFFVSGFCGLLYQVVWVRMAFASFGVITPVLSVVISVFMFGLFAGSWLAGKVVGPITRKADISAIWLYALA